MITSGEAMEELLAQMAELIVRMEKKDVGYREVLERLVDLAQVLDDALFEEETKALKDSDPGIKWFEGKPPNLEPCTLYYPKVNSQLMVRFWRWKGRHGILGVDGYGLHCHYYNTPFGELMCVVGRMCNREGEDER